MPVQPQEPPTPPTNAELEALASRNLRDFTWYALEGVLRALGWERGGAVIASLIRALIAQGEDKMDLSEASAIAVVNGLMVHGIPPRNEEEWEVAGRIYEPKIVELLKTWPPLEGFLVPER